LARATLAVAALVLALAVLPGRAAAASVEGQCGALRSEGGAVVVDEVRARSFGERAGLRPGDALDGWTRGAAFPANPLPAAGPLLSPFDLEEVLAEQAPRGPVTLLGCRGGRAVEWTLVAGVAAARVGLVVRPALPDDLLHLADEGRSLLAAGEPERAAVAWRRGAAEAFAQRRTETGLWFLVRRAGLLAQARSFDAADAADAEAVTALEIGGRRAAAARLLEVWAGSFDRRSLAARALACHRRALRLLDRGSTDDSPAKPSSPNGPAPDSLLRAAVLFGLGESHRLVADYPPAEEAYRAALRLRATLAPASAALADSLFGVGRTAFERGDFRTAGIFLRQAEGVARRLDPGSLQHARFLDELGSLLWNEGDLDGAVRTFAEAWELARRQDPQSYEAARALLHRGMLAARYRDYSAADEMLRDSLALWQQLPPDRLNLYNRATNLRELGWLASREANLPTAEAYAQSALAIQETLSPRSLGVIDALETIAVIARQRRDFDTARASLERAVALGEELSPDSSFLAMSLERLASAELAQGRDLAGAERSARRALALFDKTVPAGLLYADALSTLSEIVARRGRLASALALARQALDLRHRLTFEDEIEALSLSRLARLERRAGQLDLATAHACRAVEIREILGRRLAGTEIQGAQRAQENADDSFECVADRVAQGESAEAFRVVEASRARALLDLMAARDLDLSDLPLGLGRERTRLREEVAKTTAALSHLQTEHDAARIDELRRQLVDLRQQLDALVLRIRQASPRFAALQYPKSLDLAGARAALDPGTILLSYVVGERESFLFVVRARGDGGPGLAVLHLRATREALRRSVAALRELILKPRPDGAGLAAQARSLYRLLIEPAESRIAGSRRLLLIPDGPLHTLPFAALRRRDGRYLVEWRPLHMVVSATVYAELKRERPATPRAPGPSVVVFGDPSYPEVKPRAAGEGASRSALRSSLHLQRLPFSRSEAKAIGALFPRPRIYLGSDASEERAKALGKEDGVVHFAVHALLDSQLPLDSALVLTLPEAPDDGREDGLLHAWEIFDQVRLHADLVTLSACNSALGKDLGGEGLIGLTRAFQFAGARSVLSSLWAISDSPTARFMPRFYAHWLAGESKDEALRSAQLESIRAASGSRPAGWAAFELYGDYR
jgi:CHAT domain-containing protein/Tfp pilus assembly protein PilF